MENNGMPDLKYLEAVPPLNLKSLHYDIGPSLVLSPHPDDESLGCGGMIALLREKGIPVHVAFITDGGASHPNSLQFPPHKLAALRKQEATAACKVLGVDDDALYFFEQPDGNLSESLAEKSVILVEKLAKIIEKWKFKSLFIPYKKDAHDDHRATWKLAQLAMQQSNHKLTCIEYPIWLWKNGKKADYPDLSEYNFFRLNISGVNERKKSAIAAHRSQVTRFIDDDPEGFCLTPELLEPFLGNEEYFFFPKKDAAHSLTKNYFDKLYQQQTDPWNFEQSAYENEKYQETLKVLDAHYNSALEIGCSVGVLTNQLAARCAKLLAVDISEKPLKIAEKRCENQQQVTFKALDISKEFPKNGHDAYDLILISEMGYYLTEDKLLELYQNCQKNLNNQGQILLVHWTGFVEEYPLSGKEVHRLFEKYNAEEMVFSELATITRSEYELVLWQKNQA
jgi:LmbE family N-acetylglucosaminyl deacetylase/phospholipid N-methyltransferase